MSDHTSDEVGTNPPSGSAPSGNGRHANGTRKKASPATTPSLSMTISIPMAPTPSPLKKSKRQAERIGRGAFAASRRKEEEEDRFYHSEPKKLKAKRHISKPDSDNSNNNNNIHDKTKIESYSADGKDTHEALKVVTPSPTKSASHSSKSQTFIKQSTATLSSHKTKKRSKTVSVRVSVSETTGSSHGKRSRDSDDNKVHPSTSSSSNINRNPKRKRRKLFYKAISGPNLPIYGYALDLVSLVCNNAYSVTKGSGNRKKKNASSSPSPTSDPTAHDDHNDRINDSRHGPQQPHRVLDNPSGYTQESEPLKERLIRLQLRQRFASATSMGMSPIEFARKLLKLWGGTLEQIYCETTKAKNVDNNTARGENDTSPSKTTTMRRVVSSEKSNKCSSLTKTNNNSNNTKPTTPTSESKQKISRPKLKEELATMSNDGLKAAIESYDFDKCIGDLEPRSIHPDAQIGKSGMPANGISTGILYANNILETNRAFYDPNQTNPNTTNSTFQHSNSNSNISPKFDAHSLEESSNRTEPSKKLKQLRN